MSRSDALRRLLTLALDDAEDTAKAEAILRANDLPRFSRPPWATARACR